MVPGEMANGILGQLAVQCVLGPLVPLLDLDLEELLELAPSGVALAFGDAVRGELALGEHLQWCQDSWRDGPNLALRVVLYDPVGKMCGSPWLQMVFPWFEFNNDIRYHSIIMLFSVIVISFL